MSTIRRIYVYLVCAVALQAVVWAIIALLRNLTAGVLNVRTSEVALQLAVIVVGLPLFLVHWLWAQRSVATDAEERASAVRRGYLNVMLLAFLLPALNSTALLLASLLQAPFARGARPAALIDALLFSGIALLVTAVMAAYTGWLRQRDAIRREESEARLLLDQGLVYLLSLIGLGGTAFALVVLLAQAGEGLTGTIIAGRNAAAAFADNVAWIAVGLPLWIVAWGRAQRRFLGPDPRERDSVLRKIYLYLLVFVASLMTLGTAASLLAGFLMELLGTSAPGGSIFRSVAIIAVGLVIWVDHGRILSQDASLAATRGQAAVVRRIYLYLISGVALTAVLIGVGGLLSVLIRALDRGVLAASLREQLAWFSATLIVAFPVWLLNWRPIQRLVAEPAEAGEEEAFSLVRRLYLYFFLFVATMTLLSGTIYIVSQLIELLLGTRRAAGLLADVGQALAYVLIAVLVLLYHGVLLRGDQRRLEERARRAAVGFNVVVVDAGPGGFGRNLAQQLRQRLPADAVHLLPSDGAGQEAGAEQDLATLLGQANLIVTPWRSLAAASHTTTTAADLARLLKGSAAHKLLLPFPEKGTSWLGVEPWQEDTMLREAVEAVESAALGGTAARRSRLSPAMVALTILVSLCALLFLVPLTIQLIASLFGVAD